jgi:PPOX class probable F420-dependent enzyme
VRLDAEQARERFATSRVARFGSADADGRPHLVPVTYALVGDVLTFAVDHKPKSTHDLKRLANVAENPAVCMLVDGYDEDWTQLWWSRADGSAEVLPPGATGTGDLLDALVARYAPYRDRPPAGPVVRIVVTRWSGWAASG